MLFCLLPLFCCLFACFVVSCSSQWSCVSTQVSFFSLANQMLNTQFSSVQSLSHVWLFVIPWTAACQAFLFITNSQRLRKLMSIESLMPSNHLILCRPFLLLPSIFPSIWVFSNDSALCIRGPKYWTFSFNISPSNEYPGLISFRTDWLGLLTGQGTLKSLLQHHSSEASMALLYETVFFCKLAGNIFK